MRVAVEIARDILDMQSELQFLRAEVARLEEFEQKYHELLNQSVQHEEQMMGGWLQLLMKPGVCEALAGAKDPTQ